MSQADSHADRLRREAERVAQQAAALASLHTVRQRLDFAGCSRNSVLICRGEDLSGRWRAAWAGLGIDPSRPARCVAGSSRARNSSGRPPRSRTGAVKSRLSNPGTSPAAGGLARNSTPSASRSAVPTSRWPRCVAAPRQSSAARPGRGEAEQARRVEDQAAAAARLGAGPGSRPGETPDAWRGQWTAALAPLGLTADVTAEQAGEMVDQSVELQTRIKEARDTPGADRGAAARAPSNSAAKCARSASGSRPS